MSTTPPTINSLLGELRACGEQFDQFFAEQCAELEQAEALLRSASPAENHPPEQTALGQALEVRVDQYLDQIERMQAQMEDLALRTQQQCGESDAARQELAERLRAAEAQRDAACQQLESVEQSAAEAGRRWHVLEAEFGAQHEELARLTQAAAEAEAQHAAHVGRLEQALAQAQAQISDGDSKAMAELRAENDELISRLATLERERVGWLSERRLSRAQATSVAEQATKLAAAQEQLNQARSQLAEERSALIGQRQQAEAALARRAEQVEREMADLRRDLDLAKSQASRADQTAVSLASARGELAETRAKLAEVREEVERLRRQGAEATGPPPQVSDLEHERALLETELEMIRNRAAELTESLADEKNRIARERSEWTSELKELRTTLTAQTAAGDIQASNVRRLAQPIAAERPALSAGDSGAHAVLDSVMAQFEALQKDRRRRNQQDVA